MSKDTKNEKQQEGREPLDCVSRRDMLLSGTSALAVTGLASPALISPAEAQQKKPAAQRAAAAPSGQKPNILFIFGDDIGIANISAYSDGLMGYETPQIDRIAKEAFASSTTAASSHALRGARRS